MDHAILALALVAVLLAQEPPVRNRDTARALYVRLESAIDDYDNSLLQQWDGEPADLVLAAELLPANAHRGEALLRPETLWGARAYLDSLRSLGVRGVKVSMAYPILDSDCPRASEYLAFYESVAGRSAGEA